MFVFNVTSSIPTFEIGLPVVGRVLERLRRKQAKKIDHSRIVQSRLSPDRLPLGRQVLGADPSDQAKNGHLTPRRWWSTPRHEDNENTIDSKRIAWPDAVLSEINRSKESRRVC